MDRHSRYKACMLLGGVGDALGYNDGKWEFCGSGEKIQMELKYRGGVTSLKPSPGHMTVSDDTVMQMATAEALLSDNISDEEQYCSLAREYKQCMRNMRGRAPGYTCVNSVKLLFPEFQTYSIPFNRRGGGCGAAMRAVPIGLLYHRPEDLYDLVRVGVESGRMTHNHPTGFLGSVAVALFVSYAVQGKDVREWGEGLLHTLHTAKEYCKQQQRDWREIEESWDYFEDSWSKYLREVTPRSGCEYKQLSPCHYDHFFLLYSYSGMPGSSGHDAPMIAYDAILRSYQITEPASRWERLCRYGMFHGGDSDSTGIIAGACYGAMFGLEGVPLNNYRQLEYRDKLEKLGSDLYDQTLSFSRVTPHRYEFRLDNSFVDIPQKRISNHKKKVTFSSEPPPHLEGRTLHRNVEQDLFQLSTTSSQKDSQLRSKRYSLPILPESCDKSESTELSQRLGHLRLNNLNNYSYFSPPRQYRKTTTNILQYNYNEIIHQKGSSSRIPDMTSSHINLSPLKSGSNFRSNRPSEPIKQVIKFPPNYSDSEFRSVHYYNPINHTTACSYGGSDR